MIDKINAAPEFYIYKYNFLKTLKTRTEHLIMINYVSLKVWMMTIYLRYHKLPLL